MLIRLIDGESIHLLNNIHFMNLFMDRALCTIFPFSVIVMKTTTTLTTVSSTLTFS